MSADTHLYFNTACKNTIFTLNIGTDRNDKNSVELDHTLEKATSDQGLYYLPLIQHFVDIPTGREMELSKSWDKCGKELR